MTDLMQFVIKKSANIWCIRGFFVPLRPRKYIINYI